MTGLLTGCRVRILDSSFLIALFLDDDAHHAKALEWIGREPDEPWILPDPILFETLTVIRLGSGAPGAAAAREKIKENKQIAMTYFDARERQAILDLFLSSPLSISAADACVIYLCRRLGASALTFDKNIIKILEKLKTVD